MGMVDGGLMAGVCTCDIAADRRRTDRQIRPPCARQPLYLTGTAASERVDDNDEERLLLV